MNSVNSKTVSLYTNFFVKGFVFAFCFFVQVKVHADVVEAGENKESVTAPHSESKALTPTQESIVKPSDTSMKQKDEQILKAIRMAVRPVEPTNQLVILNTEDGFVPDKIQVKKGEAYKVHVVNISMRDKNVSFIMDSFTQSHNTIFAVSKTFVIEPQVEGIYSYQCPETGSQGQLIVIGDQNKKMLGFSGARKPASSDPEQQ